MTDYTTVSCPWCKAPIGTPCDIRSGPQDRVAHLSRQDRWARQYRKTQAQNAKTEAA